MSKKDAGNSNNFNCNYFRSNFESICKKHIMLLMMVLKFLVGLKFILLKITAWQWAGNLEVNRVNYFSHYFD